VHLKISIKATIRDYRNSNSNVDYDDLFAECLDACAKYWGLEKRLCEKECYKKYQEHE
jgi:hypothetical protein